MANLKRLFLIAASGTLLLGADFTISNKTTVPCQVGFEKLNHLTGAMTLTAKKVSQKLSKPGDKATLEPNASYDVTCDKVDGQFSRDLFLYENGVQPAKAYWTVSLKGKKWKIFCRFGEDLGKKISPKYGDTSSKIVISK
jgi:hypothetical protein